MVKNCNECLHNPICQMWRDQECQDASSFQLSGCRHFEDRSRFVEVPDKELFKAIKRLIKQYGHSKASEYVHSPVAHALFHTWKQVDKGR